MTDYLFVYGTLRQACPGAMSQLLQDNSRYIGIGSVQAKMYDIGGYPGIVLSSDRRDVVLGDVFEVSRRGSQDKILAALDAYEECSFEHPQPQEYLRKTMTVNLISHNEIQAWIYIYNYAIDGLPVIASGDYLDFCGKVYPKA